MQLAVTTSALAAQMGSILQTILQMNILPEF
jgi:hypothetical protein